jgi:hypothetical protein
MAAGALSPFVDPGEAVHPPLRGLAQRRCDRRRLQTIERRLEPLAVKQRRAATRAGEDPRTATCMPKPCRYKLIDSREIKTC